MQGTVRSLRLIARYCRVVSATMHGTAVLCLPQFTVLSCSVASMHGTVVQGRLNARYCRAVSATIHGTVRSLRLIAMYCRAVSATMNGTVVLCQPQYTVLSCCVRHNTRYCRAAFATMHGTVRVPATMHGTVWCHCDVGEIMFAELV